MRAKFVIPVLASILIIVTLGFFTNEEISPGVPAHQEIIGIQGLYTAQLYNSEGTLIETFEGKNVISNTIFSSLAGCITGIDIDPEPGAGSCDSWIDQLTISSILTLSWTEPVTLKLLPDGCDPDTFILNAACNGFESEALFDFISLSCIPGTDCPIIETGKLEVILPSGFANQFNFFTFSPTIDISPGDRLIVTVTHIISG